MPQPLLDDAACDHISDEGDIDETSPRRDIREIGHPQLIGMARLELALDQIERPFNARVRGMVVRRQAIALFEDHSHGTVPFPYEGRFCSLPCVPMEGELRSMPRGGGEGLLPHEHRIGNACALNVTMIAGPPQSWAQGEPSAPHYNAPCRTREEEGQYRAAALAAR